MNPNEISRLNQTNAVFNMPTAPQKGRGILTKPDPVAQRMYETETKYALQAHEALMCHKRDSVEAVVRSTELDTMQANIASWYREAFAESADDLELHAILMSTVKVAASIEQSRYIKKHAPKRELWG